MSRSVYNITGATVNQTILVGTVISVDQDAKSLKIGTQEGWKNGDDWVNDDEIHYVKLPFQSLQEKAEKINPGDVVQVIGRSKPWSKKDDETGEWTNGHYYKASELNRIATKA